MVVIAMNLQHDLSHEHALTLDAALDFLNTLELVAGHLEDHLHEPAEARAWFIAQGVLHDRPSEPWTVRDLTKTRAARDALREVVDAVVDHRSPAAGALDVVNGALSGGRKPVLEHDGAAVRIGHRHGRTSVDDALAALAEPIVAEIASGRPDRFRTCANDTCRWSFYDASPTGRRRWCDMKTCGNRAKAARHRARSKEGTGTAAAQ